MTDLITLTKPFQSDRLLQRINENHLLETIVAVNIKDSKDWYELAVVAPGFRKKDFDIGIANGILTISAKANLEENNTTEYIQQQFSNTSFTRTFTLPLCVRTEHVYVAYKGGLFTVTLVKTDVETKKTKDQCLVVKEYQYGQYFHRS